MKNRFIAAMLMAGLFTMTDIVLAESENEEDDETQEVVVSATKLETPTREVGSSITVITSEQIEKMQKTSVIDVLKTAPALDINQSGGPGAAASILIRGAKSEHTLVIIDGRVFLLPLTITSLIIPSSTLIFKIPSPKYIVSIVADMKPFDR